MDNGLALFLTYAPMLVDGNMITNLISIGGKSSLTGPNPLLLAGWTHMPFLKVRCLILCIMSNY
jgi:unspecific peroxygenase